MRIYAALTDAIVERERQQRRCMPEKWCCRVYRWAIERGAGTWRIRRKWCDRTTIARFEPRDRALTPARDWPDVSVYGPGRNITAIPGCYIAAATDHGRKSELSECDVVRDQFQRGALTIPKERMKRRTPHLVFLSRQAPDIFIALKTFAGGSDYVSFRLGMIRTCSMSAATLNRVLHRRRIRLRRKMVSSLVNLVRTICAELLVRYCMRQVTTLTGSRSALLMSRGE